jgi:hypothetical protein
MEICCELNDYVQDKFLHSVPCAAVTEDDVQSWINLRRTNHIRYLDVYIYNLVAWIRQNNSQFRI